MSGTPCRVRWHRPVRSQLIGQLATFGGLFTPLELFNSQKNKKPTNKLPRSIFQWPNAFPQDPFIKQSVNPWRNISYLLCIYNSKCSLQFYVNSYLGMTAFFGLISIGKIPEVHKREVLFLSYFVFIFDLSYAFFLWSQGLTWQQLTRLNFSYKWFKKIISNSITLDWFWIEVPFGVFCFLVYSIIPVSYQ